MNWPQTPQATGPWPVPSQSPYAPTAAYATMPGPQYPPPQRPRALRWVVGALVFSVLLVGAFALHRVVLSRYFGGAASPEEAVTQAIAAIENGDFNRLAMLLPPDEVAGFSDIQKQVDRISSALGGEFAVVGDLNDSELAKSIQVSVENLELDTDAEQHGLTKVSIENADITASFDPSHLTGAMKDYADEEGLTADSVSITVRGAEVTADGDTETVRIAGREQAPFVMTVERDGSWYVSPLFTILQYTTEEEGYETSPMAASPGFASPVEAAEGGLSALAESLNDRDITAFARALGGVEGKLLQTYRLLVNAQLAELDRDDFSIKFADMRFSLLSMDGNTARVRPDRLRVTSTAEGETGRVEWDGTCLEVDAPTEQEKYCLDDPATVGPFSPLVERLNYLVAVRADGGWKISPTRTYLSMIADVLSWVGDAELPIVKAIVQEDLSQLTDGAKVAATVQIGSTATVDVAQIGPYIDGGYTIVDIPNPSGKRFRVSCDDAGRRLCDVMIVTPSGQTEESSYGGSDRESGTYKGVVVAKAGEVEISVKSR